ncbi:hypothetical protein Tco_1255929 [Tanacetum coccineum]
MSALRRSDTENRQEILLKMNLSDHRIKLWWKWRYLVPVESIHSPMLTLNVFNQRQHDNLKTYNTAFATLISNVMIKKSVSMQVAFLVVASTIVSQGGGGGDGGGGDGGGGDGDQVLL